MSKSIVGAGQVLSRAFAAEKHIQTKAARGRGGSGVDRVLGSVAV